MASRQPPPAPRSIPVIGCGFEMGRQCQNYPHYGFQITIDNVCKNKRSTCFPTLLDTVYTYRQIRIFDTSVLWTLSSNFNNTSWLQL